MGKKIMNSKLLRALLMIVKHSSVAIAVIAVLVVSIGSTITVNGVRMDKINYQLYTSDQNKAYEDSELFQNIFGISVADIIRFGVIRSQLETDGRFDGKKIIDVTAYNYRESGLPSKYVTVDYYLEDLLKWADYGFETKTVSMSAEDYNNFLSKKTRIKRIDTSSKIYNTSDASYLKSNIRDYTSITDVEGMNQDIRENELDGFVEDYVPTSGTDVVSVEVESDGEYRVTYDEGKYVLEADDDMSSIVEGDTEVEILINRYKTVDGKNIEDYVSNWSLYEDLCENIRIAAESLQYNYSEYMSFSEYYDENNSNLKYFIEKPLGDEKQIFTNLSSEDSSEIADCIEKNSFEGSPLVENTRYMYYNPSKMQYKSNMNMDVEEIRNVIKDYDYAYPEAVKIWIGVDTGYQAKDAFSQGAAGYKNFIPHYNQWIILLAGALFVYFVLTVILGIFTGRRVTEDGNYELVLNGFDKVSTEISAVIGLCVAGLMSIPVSFIAESPSPVAAREMVYELWFEITVFLAVFLYDFIFSFFLFSLIRRCKARTIISNSLCCKMCKKVKRIAVEAYDNGHIVVRTWGIFVVFILFNVFMLMAAFAGSPIFLIIAVCADAGVGYFYYKDAKERQHIVEVIDRIASGELESQVDTEEIHGENLVLANAVNSIGNGIKEAVEISMKDERMKADLITNVSHDIKTPLTSIINYVDLIKREEVENKKVQDYIRILDEKSQRLKQLTDDLVEASKISSGNIILHFERIHIAELLNQSIGEFSEKFDEKKLTTVLNINATNSYINADCRRIWRVIENLFNNIYKYAMEGTRIYISVDSGEVKAQKVLTITLKNISASPLNCDANELTERFIRGDVSRTTEGSGLGLSIAKSLTEAQNGRFEIYLDGDLFKVILTFPVAEEKTETD